MTRPQYAHIEAWHSMRPGPKWKAAVMQETAKASGAPQDAIFWTDKHGWVRYKTVTNEESRAAVRMYFAQHGWGDPDKPVRVTRRKTTTTTTKKRNR